MKINSNNPVDGKNLFNKIQDLDKKQALEKNDSEVSKKVSGQDKITLSGKAKEIGELKAEIARLPDIRAEKIEAAKKSIESGDYNVDSLKVAAKILEEL